MYSSYCMSKYQVYGLVGCDSFWLSTKILEEPSKYFFIVNKQKKSRRFVRVFLLFPTAPVPLLQMILLLSCLYFYHIVF